MGSSGTVSPEPRIILFDGVCNLCSGLVQFVIKRDNEKIFRFASLQSDYGQAQLKKFHLDSNPFQSIVLIHTNHARQQSDAVLEIVRHLSGGWPVLYGLKIIPRFIRDWVYRIVANNRYRFFGKKNECWIPTKEFSQRFIG